MPSTLATSARHSCEANKLAKHKPRAECFSKRDMASGGTENQVHARVGAHRLAQLAHLSTTKTH